MKELGTDPSPSRGNSRTSTVGEGKAHKVLGRAMEELAGSQGLCRRRDFNQFPQDATPGGGGISRLANPERRVRVHAGGGQGNRRKATIRASNLTLKGRQGVVRSQKSLGRPAPSDGIFKESFEYI